MADLYTYKESISPQEDGENQIFYNRQYTFLPDNNNGNYSSGSAILFQLESIASNGKFVDWANSYLTVPLVLNASLKKADGTSAFTAASSTENVYALSMKNMPTLFHSMQVSVSNLEVVQNAAFSNLDIQYRLCSTMNSDSLKTLGPSLLFSPDSLDGYDVRALNGNVGGAAAGSAATVAGFSQAIEANNSISGSTFVPSAGYAQSIQNKGRLERMRQTSFDASQLSSVADAGLGAPSSAPLFAKNYCQVDQPNGNITYFILAVIPLKVLHPIFEQLPLCKGMVVKLNLFTNTNVTFTSTITKGAAVANVSEWRHTATQTTSAFGVCPFMVSPCSQTTSVANTATISRGLALDDAVAAGASVTLIATLGIGRAMAPQTYSHPTMTQCRLYFNTLEMNPIIEEQYFSQYPSKQILYEDRQAPYIISAVGPGQNRIQLIQNGLSRARYLLVWPKTSPGTTGAVYTNAAGAAITIDPWNAPFSSAPSTAAPYGWMTNVNVIVSGQNLYQQNFNAGWEFFEQEVRQLRNVDGGHDLTHSCGLISKSDWEAAPFFVFNLARRLDQAADDISRSFQLTFTNSSNLTLDYYCVLIYERQLSLQTSTGTLVV